MNYGEIVAAVLEQVPITHREDYVRGKVNQMIRYISAAGYFWRDIQETTITAADGVDSTTLIQSITISSLVRKLIYVRHTGAQIEKIKCVDLRALIDREACAMLANVAYLSGSSLHIKHTEPASEFALGYYSFPAAFLVDGSEDNKSNWITELAEGLVIDLTSAYLLNLKGDKEDANNMSSLSGMLKATYIQDFIASV